MTKRHFWPLLICALVVALPLSVVFSMNECQLSQGENAVRACFERSHRGVAVYWGTIATFLATSLILHWRGSRWTAFALSGLAALPWITPFYV